MHAAVFNTRNDKTIQRSDLCCVSTNDLLSLLLPSKYFFPALPLTNTHITAMIFQPGGILRWQLNIYVTESRLPGWLLQFQCCFSWTADGTSFIVSSHPGHDPLWFLTKINLNRALGWSLPPTSTSSVSYWSVFSGKGTCEWDSQWPATWKK